MSKHEDMFIMLTADHILQAIAKYDTLNPLELDKYKAKSAFLVVGDRHYSAKLILRLAYKIATGFPPPEEPFSGGKSSLKILTKLGFEIMHTPTKRK